MVGVCYSIQSDHGIPRIVWNLERVIPDRKGQGSGCAYTLKVSGKTAVSSFSLNDCVSGIMPNMETKVLLVQIFGEKSHPMRKYQRIMYWFPRFKHINPFPVPKELPEDPVDLARFSLTRIANDLDAKITVYQVQPRTVDWTSQNTFRIWGNKLIYSL